VRHKLRPSPLFRSLLIAAVLGSMPLAVGASSPKAKPQPAAIFKAAAVAAPDRYGAEAARVAAETARQTFEEGAIAGNLPTVEIPRGELDAGAGVLAMFVKAGLVGSNGEARRQIKGGGLRVNDIPVSDEKMMLDGSNLTPEGVIKLSLGKKRHVLLKPA